MSAEHLQDRVFDTGASPVENPDRLLSAQRNALEKIVLEIQAIAEGESIWSTTTRKEDISSKQFYRRPRNVFLLDGARGSGKTTLLLTIQRYMQFLGRNERFAAEIMSKDSTANGPILRHLEELSDSFRPRQRSLLQSPGEGLMRGWRTAFYLPVLFPSDLEGSQSTMEGLLALMRSCLVAHQHHNAKTVSADRVDDALKRLTDVAKGWYLSRREGIDAILRDSVDYSEYLDNITRTSADSYNRVHKWRDFVTEFLDTIGSHLLAVFIDDTDVLPETTVEILHTIRIFLDHPRIVTIVAANLRSVRHSLIGAGLSRVAGSANAFSDSDANALRDWRRTERLQVEEYLEKLLPRHLRHFLRPQIDARMADGALEQSETSANSQIDDDFKKIVGLQFAQLCEAQLNSQRGTFLSVKLKANERFQKGDRELHDREEFLCIENYMAWWLFRNCYSQALLPRTARQLSNFRSFFSADAPPESAKARPRKRLSVTLFEAAENATLAHRFSDTDDNISSWLARQLVRAQWRGDRHFEVNGRQIHEGTYSYRYLLYRLDVRIAMPVRSDPDETLPVNVLPKPLGPNLIDYSAFYPEMGTRQPLFGVASRLMHSVIPANCIYLYDVDSLPDVAWDAGDNGDDVFDSTTLAFEWPRLFLLGYENIKRHGILPDEEKTAEHLRRYLSERVFPFATFPGYDLIPRKLSKRDPKLFLDVEILSRENMLLVWPQFVAGLRSIRIWELAIAQNKGRDASPLYAEKIKDLEKATRPLQGYLRTAGISDEDPEALYRLALGYRWIVNDMRKAWHAARIFLTHVPEAAVGLHSGPHHIAGSGKTIHRRHKFSRLDTYSSVTRFTLKRWFNEAAEATQGATVAIGANEADHNENDKILATVKNLISGRGRGPSDPSETQHYRRAIAVLGLLEALPPAGEPRMKGLLSVLRNNVAIGATKRKPLGQDHIELLNKLLQIAIPTDTASVDWALRHRCLFNACSRDYATIARTYRNCVFFIWGLAPTLPTLIHLELASSRYVEEKVTEKHIEDEEATLLRWEGMISLYLALVRLYGEAAELTRLKLDCYTRLTGKKSSSDPDIQLTVAPDASYSAMGVYGLEAFDHGIAETLPRTARRPILEDAEELLVHSLNYIRALRDSKVRKNPSSGSTRQERRTTRKAR